MDEQLIQEQLEGVGLGFDETRPLLPEDAPFFYRRSLELIKEILEMEVGSYLPAHSFQETCWATFEPLIPLVDELTRPRSIKSFMRLRRQLLDFIWMNDVTIIDGPASRRTPSKGSSELSRWLVSLIPELGVLPRGQLRDLLFGGKEPQEILDGYGESLSIKPMEDPRIVGLAEAEEIVKLYRADEWQVGYAAGKWRYPHYGHFSLFLNAARCLWKYGRFIVGVESKRSIQRRRGLDHVVPDDDIRTKMVASFPYIDLVVHLDPSEKELRSLREYYERAWALLRPDFYFVGSEDYHWLDEERPGNFTQRAREESTIILWDRPTTEISTSQILEALGLDSPI